MHANILRYLEAEKRTQACEIAKAIIPVCQMNYQNAVEFLWQHAMFEARPATQYAPQHFSLARMRALLAALGDPQTKFPSVLIAGTKGKGSVAAFTESVLRAGGYRTGLYTSPHLHDVRERFQIERTPISRTGFTEIMQALRPQIERFPAITFFEITTAIAFEYFAREKVDLAVIEVGLGGRLDATNVLQPQVCAITALSYDHVELLGSTLDKIAAEKCGIIKAGVPLVCAPQPPAAMQVVEQTARQCGAALCLVGRDWHYKRLSVTRTGQNCAVGRSAALAAEYELPLLGAHQVENAAVAVAIAAELRKAGWQLDDAAVAAGLRTVVWPARCELVPGSPPYILDCAHNGESAMRLRAAIREHFPGQPYVLLFGAMQDKDISGMFDNLLPDAQAVVLTHATNPRSLQPEALGAMAAPYARPVSTAATVPEALRHAAALAGPQALVLVTGSVALVGEARTALGFTGKE